MVSAESVHAPNQNPYQPMQRLGGDFVVLDHRDADVVAAGIAAVVLFAGEITARHDAQPASRHSFSVAASLPPWADTSSHRKKPPAGRL